MGWILGLLAVALAVVLGGATYLFWSQYLLLGLAGVGLISLWLVGVMAAFMAMVGQMTGDP